MTASIPPPSRSRPPSRLRRGGALAVAAAVSLTTMTAVGAASAATLPVVDDFEAPLLTGAATATGVPLGFYAAADPSSTTTFERSTTPPEPVPGAPAGNAVLRSDFDVASWGVVVHAFADQTATEWVTQDWSGYEGFQFELYGSASGTSLFVDVIDNRPPGSTSDNAERWTAAFTDDVAGWRTVQIPFADMERKDIGNGAPNDGFDLTDIHGWAFGAVTTGGPRTFYLDDVSVYGESQQPLTVGFSDRNFDIPEGESGEITVKLRGPWREEDPDTVTVDYATEPGTAVPDRDFTPVSGTLTFTKDGPREQTFSISTIDNAKDDGDRRVLLRLSNPVGVAPSILMQAAATILDDEPFDPMLLDDFERAPDLWDASHAVVLDNPEIAAGSGGALPGQGAWERVLQASVGGTANGTEIGVQIQVQGRVCNQGNGVIPVYLLSTPTFDATTVDHTTVRFGDASEARVNNRGIMRQERDVNRDGRTDLVFHFRFADTGLECDTEVLPLTGRTYDGTLITTQPSPPQEGLERFGRDFALGQDWSNADGLSFWYQGQGTGQPVTVEVLDNRAPDPGPNGWGLVWSDEFDGDAGARPNPDNWGYEIGDGTLNGIPGWGNDERQYYTDSTDNAALDGVGNLVITLREADGELCYYGECDYTSARLLTKHMAEFAYGRIESRIEVPAGGPGLWPAFWSLGTDIDQVGWPQTGEIDFMEYVSRLPDEVYGTIHGPGYAGGQSFGDRIEIADGVPGEFRTTAVVWEPDSIKWYLDDVLYHEATPADVAPNEWVFNHPFFLLLNMAIGGNFGGAIDPGLEFPREMKVDYVRIYQGPDTAERFETSFVDDFTGWQQVTVPFADLTRSADALQPDGAPNDGLGLTDVWGYGFRVESGSGDVRIDQVRLVDSIAPEVTITDDVPEEIATGNVTFTFDFSEDVGTSFTAEDITLAGGAKGAFTRVSGTRATLVARPPADSTGVLEVSVAPGAFTDLAGNPNVVGASASQAFETPAPPPPSGDGFVITFEEDPAPVLTGFGGAYGTVVEDPTDASNAVAEIVKGAPSELWAGVTVSTEPGLTVPAIPFGTATTMTARVWSPEAGIPVRLKAENAANGAISVETEVTTTVAGDWETLTFDFANNAPGTPALDPAATYDKVSIFFDVGTPYAGEDPGRTFYLDDVAYPAASPFAITFEEVPAPTLLGFGGAEDAAVVADPTDGANTVLRVVKNPPEVWAGTIVGTEADVRVPVIPFTAADQVLTARVWSPDAGITVRLKVETNDASVNVETDATTTAAGEWETLTFDFANPVGAPVNLDAEYNRVVIFFDFGTVGSGKTYYADDITFP